MYGPLATPMPRKGRIVELDYDLGLVDVERGHGLLAAHGFQTTSVFALLPAAR